MNRLEGKKIKKFILAGKAIFTIKNPKTGNRFTFKVNRKKYNGQFVGPYFVSVLNGPDNYSNYLYIGFIRQGAFIYGGKKARCGADTLSVKAFKWFWQHLDNLNSCEVYHEGRCGRCGRKLTVPESIIAGLGPECAMLQQ